MVQFRNRYLDCRGEYHWFEWAARSTPEEGVVFAVARDVTERVQMERELLARDERERAILDNTTAIIYVKGVDGRYQFVNRRHADLFSLDRATVIGKTVYDLYPAGDGRGVGPERPASRRDEGDDHHPGDRPPRATATTPTSR